MRYLLFILLGLLFTSCGTTYQLSSYYSDDPIYGVTQSGDSIRVDVIENDFQFQRKLQWDDEFRWNFSTFAQNQPLSWYYRNFNQLGGWRSPYTPFDIYWNRNLFWSNWSFNYGFTYGYGFNRGILGLNNWGSWNYPYWGRGNYGYGWNNWRWNNRIDNRYWVQRNQRNQIANNRVYVRGRRGSTNNVVPNLRNDVNKITPRVRVNQGRRIPSPDDVDVVIQKPKRNALGRFIDKMEGNGIKVRTYQNPNNTPTPRIRNYNRVENNNRSNNNIIIRRNSNSVRQTPRRTAPTRTYSSPPSRSNNSGRSGGGVSVSRSSRGGKINQ
jgi:hypothetical protein